MSNQIIVLFPNILSDTFMLNNLTNTDNVVFLLSSCIHDNTCEEKYIQLLDDYVHDKDIGITSDVVLIDFNEMLIDVMNAHKIKYTLVMPGSFMREYINGKAILNGNNEVAFYSGKCYNEEEWELMHYEVLTMTYNNDNISTLYLTKNHPYFYNETLELIRNKTRIL